MFLSSNPQKKNDNPKNGLFPPNPTVDVDSRVFSVSFGCAFSTNSLPFLSHVDKSVSHVVFSLLSLLSKPSLRTLLSKLSKHNLVRLLDLFGSLSVHFPSFHNSKSFFDSSCHLLLCFATEKGNQGEQKTRLKCKLFFRFRVRETVRRYYALGVKGSEACPFNRGPWHGQRNT